MKDSRRQGMEVTRKAGAGITADAKKDWPERVLLLFLHQKRTVNVHSPSSYRSCLTPSPMIRTSRGTWIWKVSMILFCTS
jgi:hypothetical protein